jgi:hypothetical protein
VKFYFEISLLSDLRRHRIDSLQPCEDVSDTSGADFIKRKTSVMDEQEFTEKYGETTPDGAPRFGDDYSFLHHPSEISLSDAYKIGGMEEVVSVIEQKTKDFWCNLSDKICDKFGW